jgi:glycosyltransferase involved in cell wall biosynthesis
MSPLITVIIPSYNHSAYIKKAIDSVIGQDNKCWELIVVDDGSIDNTKDVLACYKSDNRIMVVINEHNRGQGAVLNQALKLSAGKFVCFLPSDDWYLPCKLSLQLEKFQNVSDKVGIVYGRGYRFYTDSQEILPVNMPMYRGNVLDKLVAEGNFIFPVTPMFRRECFDQFPFDESYKAEGEAIYLRLAIKYEYDFVEDYLAVMRDHSYNTGKAVNMMYLDNLRYWSDFFARNDLPSHIIKLKDIPFFRLHRLKGIESIMLDSNYILGRKALLSAICLKFTAVFDYKIVFALFVSYLPRVFADKIKSIYKMYKNNVN